MRDSLPSHGSCHPLRAAALRHDQSVPPPLPVDQVGHDANGLSPSLDGHYSASLLLRDSPSLPGLSVLTALRGCRLRLFPYHRRAGSQVPYESPDESHASCTPDITWPVCRFLPCCSRSKRATPVLMSSWFDFDASSKVHLHSSHSPIHDMVNATPFNRNVHHRGF